MQRKIILFVVLVFVARLLFGLCSEFWFEDELQTYLLGLKFFTLKAWPYFGPDVVYTQSQIPGALQGLLIGIPFFIFPIPEAPYILLNILSTASLVFLAWYCTKLTKVTWWITFSLILFAPWTLNYSTHVLNPSYVLPASAIFFVSFFELMPSTRKNILPRNICFAIMGFSLFWVYQLHMSWVLMVPVIIFVFYRDFSLKNVLWFFIGSIPMLALIIPTYIQFGLLGTGGTESSITFNYKNIFEIFNVAFRFLSFASFELPRFLGPTTKARLDVLLQYYWVIPFAVVAGVIGLLQPLSLIFEFFRKKQDQGWNLVKYSTLSMLAILYLSFFFSIKGPSAHTFYVLYPVAVIYAFYCWSAYFERSFWRKVAVIFIICGLLTNLAIAINNFKVRSMYADTQQGNGRELTLKAIHNSDYKLLGSRRSWVRF